MGVIMEMSYDRRLRIINELEEKKRAERETAEQAVNGLPQPSISPTAGGCPVTSEDLKAEPLTGRQFRIAWRIRFGQGHGEWMDADTARAIDLGPLLHTYGPYSHWIEMKVAVSMQP